MPSLQLIQELQHQLHARLPRTTRIGLDLVHLPRMAESLARFGARFERRLFTEAEIAYSNEAPAHRVERFAARFAAKEATIKALHFSHVGVSWRDMEVVRRPDGNVGMALHGRAAELAATAGVTGLLLSLSHDGDYAAAVLAVLSDTAEPAV